MAAANNEFFEALSMLEHERGITAEYLIEKIKAAIVIAVKKNYEVEDEQRHGGDRPRQRKIQRCPAFRMLWPMRTGTTEHSEIGITEAQNIRKDYKVGDRVRHSPQDQGLRPHRRTDRKARHPSGHPRGRAQPAAVRRDPVQRAHDIVSGHRHPRGPRRGHRDRWSLGKGGEAILPRNEQVPGETYTEGQRAAGLCCGRRRAATAARA